MPSGGAFTGSEVTTRNQMAIMLTKYLASMGKDTATPAQPVTFEDSAEMSEEGANAFQVLYKYGIFRGTGGMKMEPAGSTTRAVCSADSQNLRHRGIVKMLWKRLDVLSSFFYKRRMGVERNFCK